MVKKREKLNKDPTHNVRRSPSQLSRDRRLIARLYLHEFLTQHEIADRLGLSQATVMRDLKHLNKLWYQASLDDITRAKARELAKIDSLEQQYYQAWILSRGFNHKGEPLEEGRLEESTSRESTFTDKEGKEISRSFRTEKTVYPVGDSQWLKGIQWCIEQRCRILGLNAPEQLDIMHSAKAYVGVSPDDWDEDPEVIDGEAADAAPGYLEDGRDNGRDVS